jgi:hypothetical protein
MLHYWVGSFFFVSKEHVVFISMFKVHGPFFMDLEPLVIKVTFLSKFGNHFSNESASMQ